jgi:hypothetical protein
MCPDALFVEFVPVPPEHEKYCIDVSYPRRTRMHYVTHRSHQMHKHKFGVRCCSVLFCGIRTSPTGSSIIVHRHFMPRTQQNALQDQHIALDAKTQVQHKMSRCAFCGNSNKAHESIKHYASTIHTRTHKNAICDPKIGQDGKTQPYCSVSRHTFLETALGPLEHEKLYIGVSRHRCTRMHYVTR